MNMHYLIKMGKHVVEKADKQNDPCNLKHHKSHCQKTMVLEKDKKIILATLIRLIIIKKKD